MAHPAHPGTTGLTLPDSFCNFFIELNSDQQNFYLFIISMTLFLNKSYADSSNELEKTKQEFGSMPIFLYVTNKIGLDA